MTDKRYDLALCLDPNTTRLVAEALEGWHLRAAAVIGPDFTDIHGFHQRYGQQIEATLTNNPSPLVLSSRVVVTSGGPTLQDILPLGVPAVVISQPAQYLRCRELARQGLCIHVRQTEQPSLLHLAEVITGLLANETKRQDMTARVNLLGNIGNRGLPVTAPARPFNTTLTPSASRKHCGAPPVLADADV